MSHWTDFVSIPTSDENPGGIFLVKIKGTFIFIDAREVITHAVALGSTAPWINTPRLQAIFHAESARNHSRIWKRERDILSIQSFKLIQTLANEGPKSNRYHPPQIYRFLLYIGTTFVFL